jgi:hypothetical protein
VSSLRHLATRFTGSLWPVGPGARDTHWAAEHLSDPERELFDRMSRADRRHGIGVARRTVGALGDAATRPVMAAALLHDCGKLDARLGTYGRVAATLCGRWAGRDMAQAWSQRSGFTRRVGLYLRHDELGADRLSLAGSDPLVVTWARQHHQSADQWTLPPALSASLHAADGD